MKSVGGRCYQKGHPHILKEHDLLLRVSRRHGNHGSADLLQASVKAKGPGKCAVPEGDLGHIVSRGASHAGNPGHIVQPHLQVVPCIAHHCRLSCGSRTGVKPHQILSVHGKQAHGIIISEIRFIGKGQLCQILQRLNVLRLHPCLIHLLTVRSNLLIDISHGLLQFLKLNRFYFAP